MRDEPPQEHHTTLWISELRLLGEYGLTDRLAIQGLVPLRIVDTRTEYTDLAGDAVELDYENIHHRDETIARLGDIQLVLHAGDRLRGFAVGGRAGVSLPTGVVHENPFRLGEEGERHQHIQFGTGTFDPVLGLDVGRPFGAWSASAFAQTQLPLYEGPEGYQAGARFLGGLVGTRSLGTSGASARLGLTAAHERPERWDGSIPEEDGNRGRTDLFLGPGVTLPFGDDMSASIDVGVRVYGHAVGAQLDMPVVVNLSVGRLFHLESGEHVEPLPPGPQSGDIADAVMKGEAAPLEPVAGKWTVFDFWATWCEACGDLDAQLRALARARTDVAVRRVNIVDLDSPIATRELEGVTQLPHIRLVDPHGKVSWEASGPPADLMDGITSRIDAGPASPAPVTSAPPAPARKPSRPRAQTVRITVTENGYEPRRVEVKKGRPVRLVVTRRFERTCATDIVIPEYGLRKELPMGRPVALRFTPTRTGEFAYGCSMDMMISGTIVVR